MAAVTLAPPVTVANLTFACRDSSKGGQPKHNSINDSTDMSGTRLFKFPQMDFEMAVWEMTQLLIAPKKVFKSIYYHKRWSDLREFPRIQD